MTRTLRAVNSDALRLDAGQNGITLELEPVDADVAACCGPGVFVSLISKMLGMQ